MSTYNNAHASFYIHSMSMSNLSRVWNVYSCLCIDLNTVSVDACGKRGNQFQSIRWGLFTRAELTVLDGKLASQQPSRARFAIRNKSFGVESNRCPRWCRKAQFGPFVEESTQLLSIEKSLFESFGRSVLRNVSRILHIGFTLDSTKCLMNSVVLITGQAAVKSWATIKGKKGVPRRRWRVST